MPHLDADIPTRMPLAVELRTVIGPHTVTRCLEGSEPIEIGRRADSDLLLEHAAVSRQHALIEPIDGAWYITDRGSRHGTLVNGVRATKGEPMPLAAGDHLQLGPWVFRIIDPNAHIERLSTVEDSQTLMGEIEVIEPEATVLPAQYLDQLLDLSSSVHAASDEATVLEAALDALETVIRFDHSAFLRTGLDASEVEVVATRPREHDFSDFAVSQSLLRAAYEQGVARLNAHELPDTPHSIVSLGIQAAICARVTVDDTPVGFLYVDHRSQLSDGAAADDRGARFCGAVARLVGLGVANVKRKQLQTRQSRLDRELEAAQEAQRLLVPHDDGNRGAVRYSLSMRPGRILTGDLFDIEELPDGRVWFFVGDVTGKGAVASMLMAGVQGRLSAMLGHTGDLAVAIADVNRYVIAHSPGGRFITMWAGVYDPSSRELTAIDAGHGYALLHDGDAKIERATRGGSVPLGVSEDMPIAPACYTIPPGARLVLFTDGVAEQPGPGGEEFGIERAIELLPGGATAADDITALVDALTAFAAGRPLADDCTVVSLAFE